MLAGLSFTWDPPKAASNLKDHGVSFEIAMQAFADPHQLSEQDRIEGGEWRWQMYGAVGSVLLMVAYAWWEEEDGEVVRIISARLATREERIIYVQNLGSV